MNSNDAFKKWLEIIRTKEILSRYDMDDCIKELLPGFRYGRSANGPRAIKHLIKESDKFNRVVFSSDINRKVGWHAIQIAADTDYKKAIIEAIDTQREINSILNKLRKKFGFDIEVTTDGDRVDIQVLEEKE